MPQPDLQPVMTTCQLEMVLDRDCVLDLFLQMFVSQHLSMPQRLRGLKATVLMLIDL